MTEHDRTGSVDYREWHNSVSTCVIPPTHEIQMNTDENTKNANVNTNIRSGIMIYKYRGEILTQIQLGKTEICKYKYKYK